ncbi:restriction endonuclease subunit S, partial [Prevotella histicola]
MEEWKEYKLGEIINILDYKRIPLSSAERKTREGGFPYYGAQGIIDYIDDYIFDGTYLLIAEDGENLKSKKQDIAQLAHGKYWVNNHAHIVESNGICDIRYLCYILNNIDLSGYITGSAQPKLNQANLSAISIILPPLNLQEQIADFISMFDNKIALNQRINDNLEQQAQALFKSWFVNFEPFKNGQFVDSELGKIPKGWKVGYLSEIADIIMGQSPNGSTYNENGEGIIFYQGRAEFGTRFPSIRLFTTNPTRIAPANSILISVRAPVGDINITHK